MPRGTQPYHYLINCSTLLQFYLEKINLVSFFLFTPANWAMIVVCVSASCPATCLGKPRSRCMRQPPALTWPPPGDGLVTPALTWPPPGDGPVTPNLTWPPPRDRHPIAILLASPFLSLWCLILSSYNFQSLLKK